MRRTLSGIVLALAAFAQAPPLFEVASIKLSPANAAFRSPMNSDPSRVIYNSFPVKALVQIAYKAPEWKISGGPQWAATDRYDFAATLPAGASKEQIPLMLQAFLAERFHLVLKRETRPMSVYNLVVAKNGPILKPAETEDQGKGGYMKGGIFKGGIEFHRLAMQGLAEVLTGQTGRPVIDQTHLAGDFDISLKWTPDDAANNTSGASIFTALEEQLGLKLEPARAAVELLVIDRIERPSEN